MFELLLALTCMIIGYLLGSLPTGYLIAKARGIDIQKVGSGNIGATNVLRTMGVVPAAIVAIMDPLKGLVATLLPILIGVGPWGVALTGLATVLGNNFNIFLRLRGGKGVATSIGVFLAIDPWITLLAVLLGVYTIALGRYVSLGSLVGMTATPLLLVASGTFIDAYLFLAVALVALVTYRHLENIRRLANGTERRLGEKARADAGGASPTTPVSAEASAATAHSVSSGVAAPAADNEEAAEGNEANTADEATASSHHEDPAAKEA